MDVVAAARRPDRTEPALRAEPFRRRDPEAVVHRPPGRIDQRPVGLLGPRCHPRDRVLKDALPLGGGQGEPADRADQNRARDQLEHGTAELATYQGGRVRRALDNAVQAALTGQMAPAEALAQAQREAEAALRRYAR